MNRDDILQMARECGLTINDQPMLGVEHFAQLVAAATRESMKSEGWRACAVGQHETQHCGLLETAVLVEREACARVCDELDRRWINQAEKCAERIRARSK